MTPDSPLALKECNVSTERDAKERVCWYAGRAPRARTAPHQTLQSARRRRASPVQAKQVFKKSSRSARTVASAEPGASALRRFRAHCFSKNDNRPRTRLCPNTSRTSQYSHWLRVTFRRFSDDFGRGSFLNHQIDFPKPSSTIYITHGTVWVAIQPFRAACYGTDGRIWARPVVRADVAQGTRSGRASCITFPR